MTNNRMRARWLDHSVAHLFHFTTTTRADVYYQLKRQLKLIFNHPVLCYLTKGNVPYVMPIKSSLLCSVMSRNCSVMDEVTARSHFSELVRYSRPMLTAAGVITLIIMVIGVVGNSLTVVALIRNAKIRTVAAAFIASLCVSDLLFCFLVVPFAASQFFHGTWIHGKVLCSMIPLLRYGSVGVSLLSIVIISINRYILIAWPSLYPSIFTKAKVTLYIIGIWAFSYGIHIPTLFGVWGTFGLDDKLGTCSIKEDEYCRNPKNMLFFYGFATPCIVIIICYTKIFWVVRQSHKRMAEHTTNANHKRSEMHITKMVLVIFICFVVCYLPLALVKILDSDVAHPPLHVLGYILLYSASCVNPVVYVTMNKQYRQAYLNTIRCDFMNNIESYNTQPQVSRTHLSVNYLKNMVIKSPPKV